MASFQPREKASTRVWKMDGFGNKSCWPTTRHHYHPQDKANYNKPWKHLIHNVYTTCKPWWNLPTRLFDPRGGVSCKRFWCACWVGGFRVPMFWATNQFNTSCLDLARMNKSCPILPLCENGIDNYTIWVDVRESPRSRIENNSLDRCIYYLGRYCTCLVFISLDDTIYKARTLMSGLDKCARLGGLIVGLPRCLPYCSTEMKSTFLFVAFWHFPHRRH